MPRRVRSILIDSTQNRILTEVESSVSVALDKIIAKSTKQFITYNYLNGKANTVKKATNIGNGYKFVNGALITSVTLSVVTAHTGAAIIIMLKKGTNNIYASAQNLEPFSLPVGSATISLAANRTIAAGETLFVDITQVGTGKTPGAQLTVTIEYYS